MIDYRIYKQENTLVIIIR